MSARWLPASAFLVYGGEWWHVIGDVWIGTTPPAGPDPTEVAWGVEGASNSELIAAIYADTELTQSECVELVEQALIDDVRLR